MSASGTRRSTRAASRAASTGPEPIAAAAPGAGLDDNRSVATRSSTRERSKVSTQGSTSFGADPPANLANQVGFQTAQSLAVNNMSNTIGQAHIRQPGAVGLNGRLPDLEEEPDDNSNFQVALDNQLYPTMSGHAGGRAFNSITNWLTGGPGQEDIVNPAPANLQSPTIHQNQTIDPSGPSFGQIGPNIGVQTNQPRANSWFRSITSFESLETLRIRVVTFFFYISIGIILLCMLDIYRGPLLGQENDFLPFRHGLHCISSYDCLKKAQPQLARVQPELDRVTNLVDDLTRRFNLLNVHVPRTYAPSGIDYFAPQNNAEIVPKLTSPEKKRKVTGFMQLFKKDEEFNKVQKIIGPFKDRKKMWCAPSDRGKAQITVSMAAAMSPEFLRIHQNLALIEALEVDSYPKEVELWVDIKDDEAREVVLADVVKRYPTILNRTESQRGRRLAAAQTLPASFIPLGRYTYDVRLNKAEQGWYVKTPLYWFNTSTTTAAVRINSNWGNTEATCLHEVSLFGMHLDEEREYRNPTEGEIVEEPHLLQVWS